MKALRVLLMAAALAAFGASTSHADLVVGFNLGDTTNVVTNQFFTIDNTAVIPSTSGGLADSASAPPIVVTEVVDGASFSTFTGSFSSANPLDLLTVDFAYTPLNNDATATVTVSAEGQVRQLLNVGLQDTPGGATFDFTFTDQGQEELLFVKTGALEIQLTDAVFDEANLPVSGFNGFAAVSGRPTVIPEPSMALGLGGLALLAGGGVLVRRRRQRHN